MWTTTQVNSSTAPVALAASVQAAPMTLGTLADSCAIRPHAGNGDDYAYVATYKSGETASPIKHDGTSWQSLVVTYNANNSKQIFVDGMPLPAPAAAPAPAPGRRKLSQSQRLDMPDDLKLWDGPLARDFGYVEIGGGDGTQSGSSVGCGTAVGALQDFQVRGSRSAPLRSLPAALQRPRMHAMLPLRLHPSLALLPSAATHARCSSF
jgi:hypothetical protein